ncbi:MAG TPA: CBS domain-containing protein [Actinomycetota bacterium]|nr:CBS domain-containing protein [Actinomycetota bacterium]
MRANEIMSAPVITAKSSAQLKEVAALMLRHDIGAVPIVDDDELLIGIVSEDDILPLQSIEDPRLHALTKLVGKKRVARTAAEVMIRKVFTTRPDADVTEVARLMHAMHVKTLPVVEDGRVVGIISRRDVLKVLARSDGAIEAELQDILDEQAALLGRFKATVSDGVVTLRGVSDRSGRTLAETIARGVPGVVAVRVQDAA